MSVTSSKSTSLGTKWHEYEYTHLYYYGRLDRDFHPLPRRDRVPETDGEIDEQSHGVKIINKLDPGSQTIQSFDHSKSQVCALNYGQALICGIGPSLDCPNLPICLSAKDLERWSKLADYLEKVGLPPDLPKNGIKLKRIVKRDHIGGLASRHANFQGSLALNEAFSGPLPEYRVYWPPVFTGMMVMFVLFVILPIVYGGIHLTAWSFQFASYSEQLLWKIACIDIMSTAFVIISWSIVAAYIGTIVSSIICFLTLSPRDPEPLIKRLILVPMLVLSVLYALSRIFLVVESFISLRYVPIGVYATVPWVQNIPHI